VNARDENQWARDLRDIFGWSRPFQTEVLSPDLFELMQSAQVVVPHGDAWKSTVRLSSLHGELFLHSAYPTTQSDAVFFGPDTYRFADAIVHWLQVNQRPVSRAVDVCCGAGPGGVLLAKAFPEAQVFGADINDSALRLARINAQLAGVENFSAQHSDLLKDVSGEFDSIVANPPYLVDPSERAYRHGGGPLGTQLSLDIIDASQERLAPNGTLLLYTGVAMIDSVDPFHTEVEKRLKNSRTEYSYREVDPDVFGEELESGVYADCDRIAAVVLTVTRRAH
jgi:methylase of polypeptide subunit release factors